MQSFTEIATHGQFAWSIYRYFEEFKPKVIIETGLYHGNGSTTIIAHSIKSVPLPGAQFFSIECNIQNIEIATENLTKSGLGQWVTIVSGLSIPATMLPGFLKIQEIIKDAVDAGNVKLDHETDLGNAPTHYQQETCSFEQDDVLGRLIEQSNPDFVLLDSAGYMGKIEFDYLISKLTKPCAIALDDIRHVKHYRSNTFIKEDPRFKILIENTEKYGSLICTFTP